MIIIDLTPYRCPLPLVKVKLALKKLTVGEQVNILLSDPGSKQDVPRFLKKAGYCYDIGDKSAAIWSVTINT